MTKQVKTYPIGGNSAFPIEGFERKVDRAVDGCFVVRVQKNFKVFFHKPNESHYKSRCFAGHRKFSSFLSQRPDEFYYKIAIALLA